MNKRQFKASVATAVLGVLSPLAMVVPASAATTTFTSRSNVDYASPDDRGRIGADLSWVDGVAPINGDTLVFPASATYQTIWNDLSSMSYAKFIFSGDSPTISSKNFTITGRGFSLSEGIDAIMTGNGGDHAIDTNVTLVNNATFKTTGSNTLSVGGDERVLDIGSHDLTLDASGGSISLLGEITGSGKIIKSGTGKVKLLATPGAGYAGSFEVSAGELSVDETFGSGNIVISGGTLKGSGTVGDVTMSSGAIAPGNSPGCLNTSDLALTGGQYDVEVSGTTISSCQFDNLAVTGSVNLGSATTLSVTLLNSYAPAVNDVYSIILNDSTDAVQGTFKDLPDGSKFTVGAYTFQINYNGGDGNDVVLLATGTPSAPDTGNGALLSNPLVTLVAALTVAGAVAGHRFHEMKKARK